MRRVWAWWPLASVALTARFLVTWLGNVWEPALPPHSAGLSCLFNPLLLGLTIRYLNTVTWTCDWHAWFSLIYIFINISKNTFCNCKFWSVFLFSTVVLFFGGLPFAPLVLQFRAAFSSLLFQQYIVKVDLYFNPVQCLDSHISTFSNEDTRDLFLLCIVFHASFIVHYLLLLFDLFFFCSTFDFIWIFCSLFIVHEKTFRSNPGLYFIYFDPVIQEPSSSMQVK